METIKEYTNKDKQQALAKIPTMSHFEMAHLWRFAPVGSEIYFRSDIPEVCTAFKQRFFHEFGGFTPEISKQLGWK